MKKFPFKTVLLGLITVALFILAATLVWRLAVNHSFISDYKRQVYASDKEDQLLKMNSPESYLPYYNLGNVSYKNGDYNAAIAYYNKALENDPPKNRECLIRINLALSMCNTIDFYHIDSKEKVDTTLIVLYKARDILTEKGCASEEGHDGHNADAQQLKEDIDRLIEQLENMEFTEQPTTEYTEPEEPSDPSSGDDGGDTPNNPEWEQKIEQKIQKGLGNSNKQRGTEQNDSNWGKETDGGDATYSNPW
jgi:tetratricopeptide (TPR) repeat protein